MKASSINVLNYVLKLRSTRTELLCLRTYSLKSHARDSTAEYRLRELRAKIEKCRPLTMFKFRLTPNVALLNKNIIETILKWSQEPSTSANYLLEE